MSMTENSFAPQTGGSVTKRLQQELRTLMFSGTTGISAFPKGDNMFEWLAMITGPSGTVYEGREYQLTVVFGADYPVKPPAVSFNTPCFHPNVSQNGAICLDILKEAWSAAYDVKSLLVSIQSLLGEPNNDSPLNGYAAALWADQVAFKKYLDEHPSDRSA